MPSPALPAENQRQRLPVVIHLVLPGNLVSGDFARECVIAVVPVMVTASLGIDPRISAFLGGTGLLIVVSVAFDMIQRIEANLLMRNYGGFLSGSGGKGKRMKGRQY